MVRHVVAHEMALAEEKLGMEPCRTSMSTREEEHQPWGTKLAETRSARAATARSTSGAVVDPLDRKAIIHEAKGEFRRAAEYYRKTAEYPRTHDRFEEEGIRVFHGAKARELEDRATG